MTDILDALVETIEERAFSHCTKRGQYSREQLRADRHIQWLEAHLDGEARAHLEKLRRAELQAEMIEREALIRTAVAVGIRFALPG